VAPGSRAPDAAKVEIIRFADLRGHRIMTPPPDIGSPQPRIVDVYETVLYGSRVEELASFYRDVVGLALIETDPKLMAALRLPRGGVLLIFDPAMAAAP
jgi:hypothetical protein